MFIAGFVHEKINEGTFRRFKRTKATIYSIMVEDEQYEKIKNKIEKIQRNKEKYKFNIQGLLAVSIHKRIRAPRTFYCAEFVKYVLQKSGVKINLPEIIRPEDFKSLPNKNLEYQGLLRRYNKMNNIEYMKEVIKSNSRKQGLI